MTTREQAAAQSIEAFNATFIKALTEPARAALVRELLLYGRLDVGSLADKVPQDRSVVARHLQVLERAGMVRSMKEGRHTFYSIDGDGVLRQLEELTELFRKLVPVCCPTK
ncbi:MAG TPA: transcriptional regulator [Pseudomonas xinjiangensis]|uniref:Transcriptional regulator n=2 Tax=root TaxID=1 RepID=A0A7V1BRE7_9GAMM|nr:transcriptional regulator [Halopseudomonas xinjiangensis]HEC48485.1 transcriptional regulator [Halopseudomonas xinjiangensis]